MTQALILANALAFCDSSVASQAAAELRAQHARIAELEQGKCLHQIAEPAAAPFMYAIADGYGKAFFEEQGCVSSEAKDLQPEVDSLNQNLDGEPPYAVVPVYTHPTAQGVDALTPAARDVLAERKRQIEAEGWKPESDDVYDTGEMALAAACYAAHSASCAAIKAPHTARGVFVRTRSAQDFVGEMWPWSADWWKPSGHRRNLEKAAALILAEIERIDRAALAAQAKQGGAQP